MQTVYVQTGGSQDVTVSGSGSRRLRTKMVPVTFQQFYKRSVL